MSFSFERSDLRSCCSSSIGRNSDVSGEPSSDGEDSTEVEVQSQLKGPLDTMDAEEDVSPMRRGISKFYNGKSKSFTSLADAATVSSIKDLAKPDHFYKKRKNLLVHSSLLDKNDNSYLRNELPKQVADSTISTSGFNSISSSPLPPIHPQCKNSTMARKPNLAPLCGSFSLSALEFAAALAGATSNIPGFSVHGGTKCGESIAKLQNVYAAWYGWH